MTSPRADQPNSEPIAMSDTFFDEETPTDQPSPELPPETSEEAPPGPKRRRSRSIAMADFNPTAALNESTEVSKERLKKRRKKRKIILLALGSVSAFTVFSCMLAERNQEKWQGADNGQAAGQTGEIAANQPGASATGSAPASGYRPGYARPWLWFFGSGGNRSSGFRSGGSTSSGTSSGFASSGSGTVSRPSSSSSSSSGRSASSGTSRGGFGSIGGALGGGS